MQSRIYTAARRHLTTALIALSVGSLAGAGGAVAASQIHFSQIEGKVAGSQIRNGVIDEAHLVHTLRSFISACRADCASNAALGAQQMQWNRDIALAKESILRQIEAEFVHK